MPKETFNKLPTERKKEIQQILLDVFFRQPYSQVKVSEIVEKMGMSRGAFYKYFEDINDAYGYLVAVYADEIHVDLLKEIQREQGDLFAGTENYLIKCAKLDKNSQTWKILTLLFRENDRFAFRLPNLNRDSHLVQRWLISLEQNDINISEREESLSFLYFLMEIVMDLLRDYAINHWDLTTLLQEFHFKKKWLLKGISKNK